jgi:anaerobic magnesium-protoporphyrin IX monomethyl ester cyclase
MKTAIYIPRGQDDNTTPSLGPLYLLAVLEKNGFEIRLFDERIDGAALDKLISFKPEILGVSAVTPAFLPGLAAACKIKQLFPGTAVVFGGAHATALPKEVIKEAAVDYVLTGESEYTFLALCKKIRAGEASQSSLSEINNLYFKKEGRAFGSDRTCYLTEAEIDALPYPAFHAMDLEKYFSNTQAHGLFRRGKRILPVMSARGCPSQCTFCQRMMGEKIRARNVGSIISEIRHLAENYGIDEVYFEDDNFTAQKNRALEILEKISSIEPRLYLKFANGIRADLIDGELLKAMKKANVYSISFGIESGSKATLKKMKKNLNLEKARENVALAKSLGFLVGSNCIIGYPHETREDVLESLEFFKSLKLDSMAIVNLIPYPGTEVRKLCEAEGLLTEEAGDWNNYYFSINDPIPLIETEQLSKKQLVELVHKAYRSIYLDPKWIIKSLRHLTLKQIVKGAGTLLFGGERKVN